MPEQNDQGQQGQPASQDNSSTSAPSQSQSGTPGENQQPPAGQPQGEKLYAGKYKSAEELEKGYNESTKYAREQAALVKDLQGKMPKAPEKYVFDFSKTDDLKEVKLDPEAKDFKPMLDVFKEIGLSQEQADKLVQAKIRLDASLAPTAEQVKASLGANADAILSRLQTHTNKLSPEDQQIMKSISDDAGLLDFMYRHLVGEELPTPPAGQGGSAAPAKTGAELKAEAFKYKADNARSIGFDKGQQEKYDQMLKHALSVEDEEKKAKK